MIAVTIYKTCQVAEDRWQYAPLCTRVFGEQETIEAILSWAAERHGVNPVPMSDLVFTSVEC